MGLLASVNLSPLSAESGSSGGNIGNDDKSVSGVRQVKPSRLEQKQRPAEAASTSPCSNLEGTWSWYLGVSNVTFRKDGTVQHPASGTSGKWNCTGTSGSIVWDSDGTTRTDHMTLAQDGKTILIVSPWGGGIKFTSTRR